MLVKPLRVDSTGTGTSTRKSVRERDLKSEIRLEENSHGKESSRSRTTAKLTSREMWNENDHFKTLVTISTVDTGWNDER